jgi:glycosyltransferase involved in cell wall biosynthesis
MRPVYNRPEMLYLSLEYEYVARKYYEFSSDVTTLFIIESGSDKKTVELVESYPFSKEIIERGKKLGLSKNILLGMRDAFNMTDDFVIHLEDDILLHKTYFEYIDKLLEMDLNFSILSPFNHNNDGDVNTVYKGHHYAALAPLIDKEFFEDYIKPCVTSIYYESFATRNRFVTALGKKYEHEELYKYRNKPGDHNEQAGLINRLVDIALIEEGKYVMMPFVNRQLHIGYYGKNRPGGKLPGNNFDERVANLREIIKDANTMYKLSATKQYNDYLTWSPKLEEWSGVLNMKE